MLPKIQRGTTRIFCCFWAINFALLPILPSPPLPSPPLMTLKIKVLKKMKKVHTDFILHMYNINDNNMMYGSWDTKSNRQNFLSLWAIFCPLTPLTAQKIKFLKKWKNHLEKLSFYTCVPIMTIIMYGFGDTARDKHVFCHFGTFCPSTPLIIQKNKILKKWKKLMEILWFDTCVP